MFEIYNFFIYFSVAAVITLVLNFGFGQLNINTVGFDYEKFSAYECGFDPFEHTRSSFDVRFYLVAIFYIIFDLEVIFFFPLSISISYIYSYDLLLTFLFIFYLFLGVLYEYYRGKLDWSKLNDTNGAYFANPTVVSKRSFDRLFLSRVR